MCVLLSVCSKKASLMFILWGRNMQLYECVTQLCSMVVVCSVFHEVHVFSRQLEAGCVCPKYVASIFQTRSHVATQNEHVSVCLSVCN
jgi:hypothetical protein